MTDLDPAEPSARDHVVRAIEMLSDAKSPRRRGRKQDGWQSRALRQIVGDLNRLVALGVPAESLTVGARANTRQAYEARAAGWREPPGGVACGLGVASGRAVAPAPYRSGEREAPAMTAPRMDLHDLEQLAGMVADEVVDRVMAELEDRLAADLPRASRQLLTAAQLAQQLGVTRRWIYEHATHLGAIRVGTGAKPRLRFDADVAAQALNPSHANKGPELPDRPQRQRSRRRPPRQSASAGDECPTLPDLLPIKRPRPTATTSGPRSKARAGITQREGK